MLPSVSIIIKSAVPAVFVALSNTITWDNATLPGDFNSFSTTLSKALNASRACSSLRIFMSFIISSIFSNDTIASTIRSRSLPKSKFNSTDSSFILSCSLPFLIFSFHPLTASLRLWPLKFLIASALASLASPSLLVSWPFIAVVADVYTSLLSISI